MKLLRQVSEIRKMRARRFAEIEITGIQEEPLGMQEGSRDRRLSRLMITHIL